MMNFIYFSVHYPEYNREFSRQLNLHGARVLGIGDVDFQSLDWRLRESLTDYYKVHNLENYDEVLKAVAYFTHKHGKIDRFESLNEHWLEIEARIRTDFNIEGVRGDLIKDIRQKSRMKSFFRKSGLEPVAHLENITLQEAKTFAGKYGYPIIIKPDKGSGANMTYKIKDEQALEDFFKTVPADLDFIAEEFIEGIMITYDGLIDRNGNILFEASTEYGQSVMDVVNTDGHMHYISLPKVPEEVKEAGYEIMKSYDIGEKFFHLELFKSKKYDKVIPLEVNMRPPGAWMTDSINFSHDMDVYREWAGMVVKGEVGGPFLGRYYTAYASRKNSRNYVHDHEAILKKLDGKLVKHSPIDPISVRAMGNYGYQFRTETRKEAEEIVELIQKEVK
jgi:hypothetical protein